MKYLSFGVAAFSLIGCASCKPEINGTPICLIDTTTADCNEGDRHFALTLEQLKDWIAFTPESADLWVSRKEECLQNGKLPPTRDTLSEMDACAVGSSCAEINLTGYYATDRRTWARMKEFLKFCGENPISQLDSDLFDVARPEGLHSPRD